MTFFHSTGGDLVAVEPVEDAAGLLRVDQGLVDLARVGHRRLDRRLGDLVEDHPLDRDLGLERLDQVPGDRLALAVLICGEVDSSTSLVSSFSLVICCLRSGLTT